MLVTVCENRLKEKEIVLILDEAALFWHKTETVRPANVNMSKLLLTLGKLHVVLIFISHFSELLPGIISRNAVATWEKRSIKEVFVEINEGNLKIRPRLLRDVPSTSMSYDPDALAFWTLDMSVPELFSFVSTIEIGSNQWRLVLDYVRTHKGEASEEGLSPREVAVFLRRRGLSEGQIAKALNKSGSTIHLWVSETKKGEQEASSK